MCTAFRFYEAHLGGSALPDPSQVPPERRKDVLHARMNIGGTELVGSDVPPEHFESMRSAYLYFSVGSISEAERIYALLTDGGKIFMPLAETFIAFRFAMLRDRFGTFWALIYERPPGPRQL